MDDLKSGAGESWEDTVNVADKLNSTRLILGGFREKTKMLDGIKIWKMCLLKTGIQICSELEFDRTDY